MDNLPHPGLLFQQVREYEHDAPTPLIDPRQSVFCDFSLDQALAFARLFRAITDDEQNTTFQQAFIAAMPAANIMTIGDAAQHAREAEDGPWRATLKEVHEDVQQFQMLVEDARHRNVKVADTDTLADVFMKLAARPAPAPKHNPETCGLVDDPPVCAGCRAEAAHGQTAIPDEDTRSLEERVAQLEKDQRWMFRQTREHEQESNRRLATTEARLRAMGKWLGVPAAKDWFPTSDIPF